MQFNIYKWFRNWMVRDQYGSWLWNTDYRVDDMEAAYREGFYRGRWWGHKECGSLEHRRWDSRGDPRIERE